MAATEQNRAMDVIKMMASLTTTAEIASTMVPTTNKIIQELTGITNKSQETLKDLTEEAAEVVQSEVTNFEGALQETSESGDSLVKLFLELKGSWSSFDNHRKEVFRPDVAISIEHSKSSVQLLQDMMKCVAKCSTGYQDFKKKLYRAIDAASELANRCKKEAEDSKSKASTTRLLGYGTAAALGSIAFGFLVFATGGVAVVGALVAGVATAVAAACTYNRSSKLNELAVDFNGLREKADLSLRDLNKLHEQCNAESTRTKTMEDNMDTALRFFKEQERLKENETMQGEMLRIERAESRALREKIAQDEEKRKQEMEQMKQEMEQMKQEKEELQKLKEKLRQKEKELGSKQAKKGTEPTSETKQNAEEMSAHVNLPPTGFKTFQDFIGNN